jgi:molybdopterin converting factor small subunit
MVTVNFKLTDIGRIEISLPRQETLATVLQQCRRQSGIDLGGIIAVRCGQVISRNALVQDGDEIDVFPAISGG